MEPKTFKFKCPACGASLLIPLEHQGKQGQCNKCGTTITARAQKGGRRLYAVVCAVGAILTISAIFIHAFYSGIATLPDYEIVETEVIETTTMEGGAMAKRFVALRGGTIAKEQLTELLRHEYSALGELRLRGPKYGYLTTRFRVYVHASRAHWESANDWPIAYCLEGGDITIHEDSLNRYLNGVNTEPSVRFGLTEEQRKNIWADMLLGSRNAWDTAEQTYPFPEWPAKGESMEAYDARVTETRDLESEMRKALFKENDRHVMEHYSISKETYEAIHDEGNEKLWAGPPK